MIQPPAAAARKNRMCWFEAASFHLETEYPELWEEEQTAFRSGHFDNARMQLLTSATRIEPADLDNGADADLYSHIEELLPLLVPEAPDLPVAIYRSHQPRAPLTQLVFLPGELHLVVNAQNDEHRELLDEHARQILAVEVSAFARMSVDQGRTAISQQVLKRLHAQTNQKEVVSRSILNFDRSLAIWCDQQVIQTLDSAAAHREFLLKFYQCDSETPPQQEESIRAQLTAMLSSTEDPGSFHTSGIRLLAATPDWADGVDPDGALLDSRYVQPQLQLSGIDLMQRRELGILTLGFLDSFLEPAWLQTPLIRSWRGEFRISPSGTTTATPWPNELNDELRTYFCSLLLDAATCDPEISEAALAAGFIFAESRGLTESLRQMVAQQLKLGKRARQDLEQNARHIVEAAEGLTT